MKSLALNVINHNIKKVSIKKLGKKKKIKTKKKHNYGGWYNINDKGLIGTDELALDLYTKA